MEKGGKEGRKRRKNGAMKQGSKEGGIPFDR